VFETIAVMLVGMGLMFYGMKILNTETKQLTGRRLRILMEKWASNRVISIIFGLVSGAVTHSGSSASLIIKNLVLSRFLSLRNALLILAAANVGTVAIVFLMAVNIKLGIMYILGITAMLYSVNKKAAEIILVRVAFGIGMLLYGFHELEVGTEQLIEMNIVHHWLSVMQNHLIFSIILLILGFILRLLTQSSSTVAILVISLGHVGILSEGEIMFMILGAPLGAGVAMIFESMHAKGSMKQIPMFQIYFEIVGSVILIILLVIERSMGIPLIESGIARFFHHIPEFVAVTLLLVRLLPFILTLLFNNRIADHLERAFPPIKEETLAIPQFIYDQAVEDPDTAIELVDKEVARVMDRFPMYLENVRVEHESTELIGNEILHKASVKLGNDIELFIKDMFNHNLSHEAAEILLKIQNRHGIIMLIEENTYNMVKEISENSVPEDLNRLIVNIIESLHAVLITCTDSIAEEGYSMKQLIQMTSDKGGLMENLRTRYLSGYEDPSGNTRKTMMYVTDLYQRIIWLVNKWALSI